jgi:hypothetical protein
MKIQVRSFRQGLAGAIHPPAPPVVRKTDSERSVLGPYLYTFVAPWTLERVKPVPPAASPARVAIQRNNSVR